MAAKKETKKSTKAPKETNKKTKDPVTKKARPEKQEKQEKATPETSTSTAKKSDSSVWKATTVVLLLVLAVFMLSGFGSNPTGDSPEGKTIDSNTNPSSGAEISATEGSGATGTNAGTVTLDFYVMSQCPYGVQVEDAIAPVLEKLGSSVEFSINFIASDNNDGTFNSLHGENEVNGDIVQLCAIKYAPDNYMDMISCQNGNYASIPGNWESCAEDAGLDVESIRACYEGDEGKGLLSASIAKSDAIGATGSPTIYLNGEYYTSGRSETDFLRAICNAYDGSRPSACDEVPDPVTVNLIVLSDKRCEECDVSSLVSQLESLFPGIIVEERDYSDPEGKSLYDESGLTALPALLFDDTVVDGEAYSSVSPYLEEKGDYLSLRIGATFDPESEICDNGIDDNGDGQVDCDDPTCDGELECMAKLDKPKVEIFVMSHCPYGTQIEKGILPVAELLGDKIDLEIKFCDYAMHGEKELDEELTQYCIQKDFNDKYLDYLECFLADGDSEACLTETGIDTTQLDVCIKATDEEFKVKENFADKSTWLNGYYPIFTVYQEDVDKYNVGGSPTFVLNGVPQSASRSPQALLDLVCTGFAEQPAECSETLSTETPSAGFGFDATASTTTSSGGCGA